ncbi:MAG: hypothetical protein HUK08_03640 [Bacteroidaceae bacterium]|nr:hypothetical protein [Bacteroidaceae bacterium]
MSTDFTYYILCIIAIILAAIIIKRVAGCMIKAVITIILIAALAYIWFMYLR